MKYKILIIDDDIQIGNLEQEVLERVGYICGDYRFRRGNRDQEVLCADHNTLQAGGSDRHAGDLLCEPDADPYRLGEERGAYPWNRIGAGSRAAQADRTGKERG